MPISSSVRIYPTSDGQGYSLAPIVEAALADAIRAMFPTESIDRIRQQGGLCFICGWAESYDRFAFTLINMHSTSSVSDAAERMAIALTAMENVQTRDASGRPGRRFAPAVVHTTTTGEDRTVFICGCCYTKVQESIATQADLTCAGCAVPMIREDSFSTYVHRNARCNGDRITTLTIYEGDISQSLAIGSPRYYSFDYQGPTYCLSCYHSRFQCRSCNAVFSTDLMHSCDECGIQFRCSDCFDTASHAGHASPRSYTAQRDIVESITRMRAVGTPENDTPENGAMNVSRRTVGQEVETGLHPDARRLLGGVLIGIAADVRNALGFDIVNAVVGDGSISLSNPTELRGAPVSGGAATVYADAMGEILTTGGFGWNLSCGAHVHVGTASRNEAWRIYVGMVRVQHVLMSVCDSRRWETSGQYGNMYAIPVRDAEVENLVSWSTANPNKAGFLQSNWDNTGLNRPASLRERYRTVNATSYAAHRTIELRLFSGDIPHNAELNASVLAVSAGLADYFATDEGWAAVLDIAGNAPMALLSQAVECGYVSRRAARFFTGELAVRLPVETEVENESTRCSDCDCDCESCYCQEPSGCSECNCNECSHELLQNSGRYLTCDNCGWEVARNPLW